MLPLVFARCENLPIWGTTNYQTKIEKKKDFEKEPKIGNKTNLLDLLKGMSAREERIIVQEARNGLER